MARAFLRGALLGSATAFLCTSAAAPTVVDGSVSYVGVVSGESESFLGIKYGQDTSGINRFKAPSPFSYSANTVVNATTQGPACPQKLGDPIPAVTDLVSNVTIISEDCLHARVDRPLNTRSTARLPVLVFLYGGGYNFGQIYDVAYDPEGLVSMNAAKGLPVIYVAINYRVGIFGFAQSTALRNEQNLNSGLMDQHLGLQWVQDHIRAFGGDPDNVTIFGQDSGWSSVAYQLMAYGGAVRPTFKRAILESGPTPGGDGLGSNATQVHVNAVIAAVNCTSPTGDSASELVCLRALPRDTLLAAAVDVEYAFDALGGMGTFRPAVPSPFLPDVPSALLRSGRFLKGIDIMAGWNEDDGTLLAPPTFLQNSSTFIAWGRYEFPGLSTANFNRMITLYPESEFTDLPSENINKNFFRAARVVRDAHFTCPSLYLTGAMEIYSPQSSIHVWAVNTSVLQGRHALGNTLFEGVDHFADIPYVFGTVSEFYQYALPEDYTLASLTSGSWAAFAYHGRPTLPGVSADHAVSANLTLAPWNDVRAFGIPGGILRIIGGPRDGMATLLTTGTVGHIPAYNEKLTERCAFWNSLDVLSQTNM